MFPTFSFSAYDLKSPFSFGLIFLSLLIMSCGESNPRTVLDFNNDWKFLQADDSLAFQEKYDDSNWRALDLPHDWSIEGNFSAENPTGRGGGALPAGIGWYRKEFSVPKPIKGHPLYIEFGGVYRNSEVWINGNYLGKRPSGYSSFRYDLSPYLNFAPKKNVIAVRVDNSEQPNSRWYTGSGIYRNVRLVTTGTIHIDQWGTYVTTPVVTPEKALVNLDITLKNMSELGKSVSVFTRIMHGDKIVAQEKDMIQSTEYLQVINQQFTINHPELWSVDSPVIYKAITLISEGGMELDQLVTSFGIRTFDFTSADGFFLNGKPLKIHGVNLHHDLGALGAAFNRRAAERQLEIMKAMGVNGIRMAHNPPAEELLDLCDQMGFIVIDEAFDCWAKKKAKKDYHLDWDKWHVRDLQDMVRRDRNHPSVLMWSIGNEIREQFDSTGTKIAMELANIVRSLDNTRLITSGLTENMPGKNFIIESAALDVLGFNYKHEDYADLPYRFPGQKFLASETGSAYATRGVYNMPSDYVQFWPAKYGDSIPNPNPDHTISAYDMIAAYWGSTHESVWKTVKSLDHMAGIYIWSGFDYLGEPDPYPFPARSSYFGVVDLAGFPKDAYYMYQSEWTDELMLHVFPHWNWKPGETIDLWAYYNHADEVELFLNGQSQGVKKKENDDLHVMWRLAYEPGEIKVISRKEGKEVLTKVVETAGDASQIQLTPDRTLLTADGYDLSFITVDILDEKGRLAPNADNEITFSLEGPGKIAGTDNGYQASWENFKTNKRKAWKGKCLLIVQTKRGESGEISITASADGLNTAHTILTAQ